MSIIGQPTNPNFYVSIAALLSLTDISTPLKTDLLVKHGAQYTLLLKC